MLCTDCRRSSKCGRYHRSQCCKRPRYASPSLFYCRVFLPPPIVTANTTIQRSCLLLPSINRACNRRPSIVCATAVHQLFVLPISIAIPPPPIDRDDAVDLALTAATTAHAHQIAAEALPSLISEATADVKFVQEEWVLPLLV